MPVGRAMTLVPLPYRSGDEGDAGSQTYEGQVGGPG